VTTLTPTQAAAALAEEIYRRDPADQALSLTDINPSYVNKTLSTDSVTALASMGIINKDGYYYDDSTGFVGQVVTDGTTTYVVYRGTDAGSSYLNSDGGDWFDANVPLGLGTTAGTKLDGSGLPILPNVASTQLDDALALAKAAISAANGSPVVVVGQSLGEPPWLSHWSGFAPAE
jgi:hypothetical protein